MGIEESKLNEIRAALKDSENATAGYGFVSIAKRLSLFYGESYSMTIDSTPGEGTRVQIRIPALREEEIKGILRQSII